MRNFSRESSRDKIKSRESSDNNFSKKNFSFHFDTLPNFSFFAFVILWFYLSHKWGYVRWRRHIKGNVKFCQKYVIWSIFVSCHVRLFYVLSCHANILSCHVTFDILSEAFKDGISENMF
jgi:hypothetical protein